MGVFSRLHKLLQIAKKTKSILYLESAVYNGHACAFLKFFPVVFSQDVSCIIANFPNIVTLESCLVIAVPVVGYLNVT